MSAAITSHITGGPNEDQPCGAWKVFSALSKEDDCCWRMDSQFWDNSGGTIRCLKTAYLLKLTNYSLFGEGGSALVQGGMGVHMTTLWSADPDCPNKGRSRPLLKDPDRRDGYVGTATAAKSAI